MYSTFDPFILTDSKSCLVTLHDYRQKTIKLFRLYFLLSRSWTSPCNERRKKANSNMSSIIHTAGEELFQYKCLHSIFSHFPEHRAAIVLTLR